MTSSTDHTTVPAWPLVQALLRDDGSAEVTINGTSHPVTATSLDQARERVVTLVSATAAKLGRPVRLGTNGPDGGWPLIVHPDGTVEADTAPTSPPPGRGHARSGLSLPQRQLSMPLPTMEKRRAERTRTSAADPTTATRSPVDAASANHDGDVPNGSVDNVNSTTNANNVGDVTHVAINDAAAVLVADPTTPADPAPVSPDAWLRTSQDTDELAADPAPRTRREARRSFLTEQQLEEPAAHGVRGLLARVGVRVSPSESERAERADVHAVSQHWPGPRTIAVVNGKGGAGKTPTTVLLAAVFARHGGAGVLTWDNNQTRGTLGWRTEQGPHEATLLDLLPQVDQLLGTSAQSADLAHYVHHQTRDRFDVLRSKPMALADEQRVEPADVDAIHAVAAKYYRLIFLDSGNDESDPMWLRMIDHTDQLVVATTTRDDHAEAGALLLEALAERDEHSATLAANAVAVVTQAEPRASTASVQRVADGYRPLTRAAVTIPFDPAIVDGVLRYGSLRTSTQRAWLAAGAAVADGL